MQGRLRLTVKGRLWLTALALAAVPSATIATLAEGLALAERRAARDAIAVLDEVLQAGQLSREEETAALVARGKSHKALLVDDKAVDDFLRVFEMVPDHPEASFQLGVMYATGRGVPKSGQKEFELLLTAAEQGHLIAQRLVSQLYFARKPPDLKASHRWLMSAADRGEPVSQRLLASRYASGRGLIKNRKEAFKWYELAARQGDVISQFQLARAYELGDVVELDMEKAMAWLHEAAARGLTTAQKTLAERYLGSNEARASHLFWRAAKLGNARSRLIVAERYLRGAGVPQNFVEARKWYVKARKDAAAQFRLGEIHEKGLGTEASPAQAIRYYRQAAKARRPDAMIKMAMMYKAGLGVEANEQVADNYLNHLREQSGPTAWNAAAWALATDENPVLRDGELAKKFISRALKQDKNVMFLDTRAAVEAELGNFKRAVSIQRKLVAELPEGSPLEGELRAHLAGYLEGEPWRERYGPPEGASQPLEPLKTVFVGSIIVLRGAAGYNKPGIVLDEKSGHVMEILVQEVTNGFLPYGQDEYLVVYFEDPTAYFTEIKETSGVFDYPLESRTFRLIEDPAGGWHYRLVME